MNWKTILLVGCAVFLWGCGDSGAAPAGKDSMGDLMKEGPKPAESAAPETGKDGKPAPQGVRGR